VSYALASRRPSHALGDDPHPLCTDPNAWKDSATCAETGCKQGYAATVYGDCVLVGGSGSGAVANVGASACAAAGGTWDAAASECRSAPESSDEGEGTGIRWPWSDSPSGGGGAGGSAFEAGKPTLASVAKSAAPWVVGAVVGVALLVHYARPT
jgi:hypothetical protein